MLKLRLLIFVHARGPLIFANGLEGRGIVTTSVGFAAVCQTDVWETISHRESERKSFCKGQGPILSQFLGVNSRRRRRRREDGDNIRFRLLTTAAAAVVVSPDSI